MDCRTGEEDGHMHSTTIVQIQYLAPKPRLSIRDYEWLRTKSELQSGSQAVSVWNILIGLSHNRSVPAPSSSLKPSHWPAKMHAGFFVHENLLLPPESESSAARQPQTAVALEQGPSRTKLDLVEQKIHYIRT